MAPSFTPGGGVSTPFGQNEYLRSVRDVKTESYTVAASTVPAVTIDGVSGQKILQPGVVMAKITSGTETGKIGPRQAAGTEETQTLTKAGTVSGGTFTLSYGGVVTGNLAYDITAANLAIALNAVATVAAAGGVTVTGGPLNTGAFTVTFTGVGVDHPLMVSDVTLLTGAGAGVTVAEGTKGVVGAVDGREVDANVVGINDTFLPWQLMDRDVEVAVVYEASIIDGRLLELNAAGAFIAATSGTMTLLKVGTSVYEYRVK